MSRNSYKIRLKQEDLFYRLDLKEVVKAICCVAI